MFASLYNIFLELYFWGGWHHALHIFSVCLVLCDRVHIPGVKLVTLAARLLVGAAMLKNGNPILIRLALYCCTCLKSIVYLPHYFSLVYVNYSHFVFTDLIEMIVAFYKYFPFCEVLITVLNG